MEYQSLIQKVEQEIESLSILTFANQSAFKRISQNAGQSLAPFIEHTILKPQATQNDIITLCNQAKEYQFYGVCVNPLFVSEAKKQLQGTNCQIVTVIGFPLGMTLTEAKTYEAKKVIQFGANEIDMVIAVGLLKSGQYHGVFDDIRSVVDIADKIPVKVIIETCLLTQEEKIFACLLSKRAGAAFVKTSTGFSTAGATVDDVKLMRAVVGNKMGIKAAGGIKDKLTAQNMIGVGADRLGCSASIQIIK